MKNEEIDRLFRQKLEQLEAQPTPQAWKQLEEQLQHKKKRTKWGYLSGIAASLLLLMGIWGVLEYSSSMVPAAPVAQEHEKAEPQEPAMQEDSPALAEQQTETASAQENTKEQPLADVARATKANKAVGNNNKAPRQAQNAQGKAPVKAPVKEAVQKIISEEAEQEAALAKLPQVESKAELINSLADAGAEVNIKEPAFLNEQVIISYKADDDKDYPAQASIDKPEDRELSARKVVGFLKKVKENSGSLAELREAKDDLLSLRLSRAN